MQFPCVKCNNYENCEECKLIIEYEMKKLKQEEKKQKSNTLKKCRRLDNSFIKIGGINDV